MKRLITIHEALALRLGREPTRDEVNAEMRRILSDAHAKRATEGKLRRQRKGGW